MTGVSIPTEPLTFVMVETNSSRLCCSPEFSTVPGTLEVPRNRAE